MTAAAGAAGDRTGLGIALSVLAMVCFASMDAVSKHLAEDYAIVQILWVRYAFFLAFALLVARRVGVRNAARSRRPWLQASRALLLLVENGAFVLAFRYLPLADTHAIAASSPLLVVALSVPVLGEKVGIRRWLAVLAGFAGVLLIVRPGFQTLAWPILIPLAGAFLWASYQILVRLCGRTDSSETTLLYSAAVGLAVTSLLGPLDWTPPDAAAWGWLLAVAAIGSTGHLLLIKALQYAEAGAVQPFSYSLLVWATVLGAVVFGDLPDLWTVAGAAIVVASGLYTWYRERRRARPA